jgi:acetylornithine deacetylase
MTQSNTAPLPRLSESIVDRIRTSVHAGSDASVKLLQQIVRIPSITGGEGAVAEFVGEKLRNLGFHDVNVEEFSAGRSNAWGVLPGQEAGQSVMFLGHLDTVNADGWSEHWEEGDLRKNPFSGAVVDGHIWGRGVGDTKGGIGAFLSAIEALKGAGLEVLGDVSGVFVGDEESGEHGSGLSAGIAALMPRITTGEIPRPDFAVYVEPTEMNVYTAQMGFFVENIRIEGKTTYFGTPWLGVDALKATHELLSAVWAYNDELEKRATHDLMGFPFLVVTAIKGGGVIAVPGDVTITIIRKLLPGEDLTEAKQELEQVLFGTINDDRITLHIENVAPRDHPVGGTPHETDTELPVVAQLQDAIKRVLPQRGAIAGAPYWSELPFLRQLGIPGVYAAPGDIRNCHTAEERVELQEYLDAITAYAIFIAGFCGVRDAALLS